ncbi:MAG: hypothetical protein QOJ19_2989 [Acidimicrobiia bacterium]|nr:hypothetical protein [Acidimicrobiia bacterium]
MSINRIKLDTRPVDAATRMAEGNPGAATVVGQLWKTPSAFGLAYLGFTESQPCRATDRSCGC